MVNDVNGEKGDGHSHVHVFKAIKRSLEVHVLDVGPSIVCSGCANGAISEEFG